MKHFLAKQSCSTSSQNGEFATMVDGGPACMEAHTYIGLRFGAQSSPFRNMPLQMHPCC